MAAIISHWAAVPTARRVTLIATSNLTPWMRMMSSTHMSSNGSLNMRRDPSIFPTKFIPLLTTSTPQDLFSAQTIKVTKPPTVRFISRTEPTQILIHTDGACPFNGKRDPRAGWAFVFRPGPSGTVSGRVETSGPQTSNRAELRAVLAALRDRDWAAEGGIKTLVIASDSNYVVEGATVWARKWVRAGWRRPPAGKAVRNRDLWELVLAEVERLEKCGTGVCMWLIPREWNRTADRAAKEAAKAPDAGEYTDVKGD